MIDIPEFRCHPLLRGGHRQTLVGFMLRGTGDGRSGQRHIIELPDGDQLVLHDDCPSSWGPSAPVALLMHGLSGCHQSSYLVRVAEKLRARGLRTFRLDHRGSGAAENTARYPYHAGRSDDVFEAVTRVRELCRGSLIGAIGFSLSGNMLLKMLGEVEHRTILPRELACAVAVNPPIDLELCSQALARKDNRIYDSHFTKWLYQLVEERIARFPDAPRPTYQSMPRCLRDFDTSYTAIAGGFDGIADYYARCSSQQFVPTIQTPTLILTAQDDPLIPASSFEKLPQNPAVRVHIAPHGGHLGYLGTRGNGDPDRRWMDWRVVDWLTAHLRPSGI